LADLADPFDYSAHINQLIRATQLIAHGADVNAVSEPHGKTPLHDACYVGVVTNLDFSELLLEKGAGPNAQDHLGLTPVMCTTKLAPGSRPRKLTISGVTQFNLHNFVGQRSNMPLHFSRLYASSACITLSSTFKYAVTFLPLIRKLTQQ
jgi:hypothetical protein